MRVTKFEIDGKEVMFVNQYRNTRHGFAHDTTMFVNGCEIESATCHYLNRTWECYTYQSVMLSAVRKMINYIEECNERKLKECNNWIKLTPSRKEELKKFNEETFEWQFYNKVYDKLNER